MPATYGVPPNMSSAAPAPAPTATPNTSRPGAGPSRNALIGPQATGGTHRIPGDMLEGLPPEFVQALFEIAQLVDIDGDGTPDVAVVPLNATGQNALSRGPNALMGGAGSQPQLSSPMPGARW